MSKSLKKGYLSERAGRRTFLAISLCASMVAVGCTTNRNVGNGGPVVTPGVRTVPTGGTATGSESQPVPPPMMSSSAAAATMAPLQSQPRVTYLGPAAPGGSINFVWMMAANVEDADRQYGVVNVHPDFAALGSGLDKGRAARP